MYVILYKIEHDEFSIILFDLAKKIYVLKDRELKEEFYNNNDPLEFFHLSTELQGSGACFIKNFDYIKYNLILLFNHFLIKENKKETNKLIENEFNKYNDSFFEEEPFLKSLDELNIEILSKFFNKIEKNMLVDFKKVVKNSFNKLKKEKERAKLEKIDNAEIDSEILEEFKLQVIEERKNNDLFKRYCLNIKLF